MKTLEVVCAAIVHDGEVMIARRTGKSAGWYEFPGGKVEPHETKEEAIRREIKEELDIGISNIQLLGTSTDEQNGNRIELTCFTCTADRRPDRLYVHDEVVWTVPSHIYDYHFFEADRELVRLLEDKWETLPGHRK